MHIEMMGARPKRFTPTDQTQGSAKNRVVIEEKPALIKGVIDYLYTLDYHMEVHTPETDLSQEPDGEEAQDSPNKPDSINEDKATACNTLSLYISMYSLADRLLIHGLKALSKEKFEKELARRWLDPSTFSHAVSEIYNSTPESDRGLRDLIVNVTMDNLVILRTGAKTMDSTVAGNGEESGPVAFPDSLARSVPQFSSDLAVEMMNRTVADWNRHGTCKPNWVQ
ncbi:unnamed protein product [Penicillium egyptiacum]|uniref:BTB domain-containing protein n=1 Tax=Penicillium egyptiacum TaxID=1303716 RepID=A0A9W4P599_9EURO|nr:unnamed protein product [Penicillium egyptiacum]